MNNVRKKMSILSWAIVLIIGTLFSPWFKNIEKRSGDVNQGLKTKIQSPANPVKAHNIT